MDFFIMKVKLFFLAIIFFMISCSKKKQDNDLSQLNLKGNIESIKEYWHKIDDNYKYKTTRVCHMNINSIKKDNYYSKTY